MKLSAMKRAIRGLPRRWRCADCGHEYDGTTTRYTCPSCGSVAAVSVLTPKAKKHRSPKARANRRARAEQKAEERAEKNDRTAAIRAGCFARAGERCENPGHNVVLALAKSRFNWRGERPAVLDHFFGRGHVPQALTNCWAICNTCNFYKTDNRPSARQWFDWFIAHAIVYEYEAEIERARARLNGMLEVRDRAAAASTTSPAREHVLPTRD